MKRDHWNDEKRYERMRRRKAYEIEGRRGIVNTFKPPPQETIEEWHRWRDAPLTIDTELLGDPRIGRRALDKV